MAASRSGTLVIEFLGADGPNYCYSVYAFHLNQRYFGTISHTESRQEGPIHGSVEDALEIISIYGGEESITTDGNRNFEVYNNAK